ncbi:GAF domain-containing protein [Caldiplasma sukawensis]
MESSIQLQKVNDIKKEGIRKILSDVCSFLSKENEKYNWTGVYVVRKDSLYLEAFYGDETEHKVIKIGEGLCSLAITLNKVVNEDDVKSNSKYIACFPQTNSELVVPIKYNGKNIGEIDIDSDTKRAFNKQDEELVKKVCEEISLLVYELYEE